MRWASAAAAVAAGASALLVGQQRRLGDKPAPQLPRDAQQRTLIVGDKQWLDGHKELVDFLNTTAGHKVTLAHVDDSWPSLHRYAELSYDNVIVGDPEKPPTALARDFSDKVMELAGEFGGSVVILGVGTSGRRTPATNLVSSLRVRYTTNVVKDEFKNQEKDARRLLVTVAEDGVFADPNLTPAGPEFEYSGRAFVLNDQETNSLVQPAVEGRSTTCAVTNNGQLLSDKRLMLIFGLETRTSGGRIVAAGDRHLCSSQHWVINGALCKAMLRWAALETGIIDWSNFTHMHANGTALEGMYLQRDNITVSIDLHERRGSSWEPVQSLEPIPILQHVKQDPHWRIPMARNPHQKQTFSATIKAPEDHGIFKFVITVRHRWWSTVWQEMIAPVRNFRHDDFPRFLPLAIPYYIGCFVTIAMLVVFCIMYTLLKDAPKQKAT